MALLPLRHSIGALGLVALAAQLAQTALSFAQAATLWDGEPAPNAQRFFRELTAALPSLPVGPTERDNTDVLASHLLPVALATAATLLALVLLQRHEARLDASTARLLKRWAIAFAVAALPAFPVFTQDFWLSAAWGRMIADGVNPYHVDLSPGAFPDLPLDHFAMPMSYGPLWGLASAALMAVTGGSVLAAATLFKTLLLAAWLGVLVLVDRLMQDAVELDRCRAMLLVGWLPAGVGQTVAEGHNDVVMVALLLLWWLMLRQGRARTAPLALAASALCKYVTVPLFALDAIHALRVQRLGLRASVLRFLPALALMLAVLGLFYRSPEFFHGVLLVGSWQFLHLRDAFAGLGRLVGLPLTWMAVLAQLALVGVALLELALVWRTPTRERLDRALIAMLAALVLALGPHLWPWYMIWVLAPAVLRPGWWLSRFIISISVLAPFLITFWWIDQLEERKDIAALILYGGALLGTFVVRLPRTPDSSVRAAPAPARAGD